MDRYAIVVTVYEPAKSTEHEGKWPEPTAYFGPFDSYPDAISWLENDCPEDERELATVDEVLASNPMNSPDSIHGDTPDIDIRD